MPSELKNKPFMQKSVVAGVDIKAGEIITADTLTCKRPGLGLEPLWLARIAGKRALRNIQKDDAITLSSIDWDTPGE
jgi:sialic acid synthase SpsE